MSDAPQTPPNDSQSPLEAAMAAAQRRAQSGAPGPAPAAPAQPAAAAADSPAQPRATPATTPAFPRPAGGNSGAASPAAAATTTDPVAAAPTPVAAAPAPEPAPALPSGEPAPALPSEEPAHAPAPAEVTAEADASAAAEWKPGDHDLLPLLPRGKSLFDSIPADAVVLEALCPAIGNGAIIVRRPDSVGVILVRQGRLFEKYAFREGRKVLGEGALNAIKSWQDGTVSAFQFDPEIVEVLPSLLRGESCYEDLRLGWADWEGLLADLRTRQGAFVVELDTPLGRGVTCVRDGRQIATFTEDHPEFGEASLLDPLAATRQGTIWVSREPSVDEAAAAQLAAAADGRPEWLLPGADVPAGAHAQDPVPAPAPTERPAWPGQSDPTGASPFATGGQAPQQSGAPAFSPLPGQGMQPVANPFAAETPAPAFNPFGQPAGTDSIFGQPVPSQAPFGQPAAAPGSMDSPYGQQPAPSPFGDPAQSDQPFGQQPSGSLFAPQPTQTPWEPQQPYPTQPAPEFEPFSGSPANGGTGPGGRSTAEVVAELKTIARQRLQRSAARVEAMLDEVATQNRPLDVVLEEIRGLVIRGVMQSTLDEVVGEMTTRVQQLSS